MQLAQIFRLPYRRRDRDPGGDRARSIPGRWGFAHQCGRGAARRVTDQRNIKPKLRLGAVRGSDYLTSQPLAATSQAMLMSLYSDALTTSLFTRILPSTP